MRFILASLLALACHALYAAPNGASTPVHQPAAENNSYRAHWPLTSDEISAGITMAHINPYFEPYDVRRYGADPASTVDSTAAMIRAHATGHPIHYPAGTYKFSSGIAIPCGGIIGDGAYKTVLLTTDTGTSNLFTYTCATAGLFRDFQVEAQSAKSGGVAIVVQPKSGEVSAMRFLQVVFNGVPNGINFVAASQWSVIGCHFYGYTHDALTINNTNNPDSGDSIVADSIFTSPGTKDSYAIHQIESGGLRVVGNKFNNGGIGILLDLGVTTTSDLLVTGNSFENAYYSAIQLQRMNGTATFSNVVVTGNQFLLSSASGDSSGVYANGGPAFLNNLTIVGNTFSVADLGSPSAILLDYVSNAVIEGNTIVGSGTGKDTVGIRIGEHNINVKIGPNLVTGFRHSVNGPAGLRYIPSDFQSGTTMIVTTTPLGSLYTGTISITFPKAWDAEAPPTLQNCTVVRASASGGGAVSVYPVSVTATTLVMGAVGTNNGGSVPIQWSCAGVL